MKVVFIDYRIMNVLDSYIPRKLPIVALICTVFITYPNVVWIPWNLARLNVGEELGFWAFFAFRMIYFYGLFFFQLRYNVRKIGNMSFAARFGRNFIYTLVGCAAFVGLSYGLPLLGIQTGYVGNILLFQFFVVCLLCTFIGYILVLNVTVHNQIDSDHRMDITIRMNGNELEISNPVYPKLVPPDTNGISLQNLRNRFGLIMKREIRVETDGDTFNVYLPLR